MDQSFVDVLNKLMAGSGISNNELARRIEVDPAQIGRWRKGHGRPRPENLVRAAAVFGVDHRWLWALAYPEGVPLSDGPDDPQWSGFIAEIEAGWRAMDESTRDWAVRTARVLFSAPSIHAKTAHGRNAKGPRRSVTSPQNTDENGFHDTPQSRWNPLRPGLAFVATAS